jgi:hypothetical protein
MAGHRIVACCSPPGPITPASTEARNGRQTDRQTADSRQTADKRQTADRQTNSRHYRRVVCCSLPGQTILASTEARNCHTTVTS